MDGDAMLITQNTISRFRKLLRDRLPDAFVRLHAAMLIDLGS
jgi:hypothetical protein